MKAVKLSLALRWALVPVASMAACSSTVVIANTVGNGVRPLISPAVGSAIEAAVPVDVRAGIVYAVAAALWVIAGAWVAPARRAIVPVLLYIAGASLAWLALDDWYFPESHPRAYQTSHVPLALTLIGGLVGVAAVIGKRKRAAAPSAPALQHSQ